MSLNVAEIRSLLRRAHQSAKRGYQIALGDEYAQKLAGTDGSPKGLIDLCQQALAGHAEPVEAPSVDQGPPTWAPPAPVAPSVSAESVELAVPVEVPEEPAVEEVPVEVEAAVDVTTDATVEEESAEEEGEGEPEAEEPVEPVGTEAADVAKAPKAGKRSKGRRGK